MRIFEFYMNKNCVLKNNFYISIRCISLRILFFGSDAFSVYSLSELLKVRSQSNVVKRLDIVTTIGLKSNHVSKFCGDHNLLVKPWPLQLRAEEENAYDLGVVVSFGHLIPKKIIDYFPMGMINVHASLLPRWRGASPIIHSIMNGDTSTGVTIMRIAPHHFDTGDVLLQKPCTIGKDELMPSLYERLGKLGAEALIETIPALPDLPKIPQSNSQVTYAPRIKPDIAFVRWDEKSSVEVYNTFRALFSIHDLKTTWHGMPVKLKKLRISSKQPTCVQKPGMIYWDKNTKEISVVCRTGSVLVDALTVGGKPMKSNDFFNGYLSKKGESSWFFT